VSAITSHTEITDQLPEQQNKQSLVQTTLSFYEETAHLKYELINQWNGGLWPDNTRYLLSILVFSLTLATGDTCSRNLYQNPVRETCMRILHAKIWCKFITVSCTKTTLRPITLHGSCHVLDSFCPVIELCSISCKNLYKKKLVQDWPTHVQVCCTRWLAQVSGTSFSSVCRRH